MRGCLGGPRLILGGGLGDYRTDNRAKACRNRGDETTALSPAYSWGGGRQGATHPGEKKTISGKNGKAGFNAAYLPGQ